MDDVAALSGQALGPTGSAGLYDHYDAETGWVAGAPAAPSQTTPAPTPTAGPKETPAVATGAVVVGMAALAPRRR